MDRGNGTGSVSLPDKESTGDESDEFETGPDESKWQLRLNK